MTDQQTKRSKTSKELLAFSANVTKSRSFCFFNHFGSNSNGKVSVSDFSREEICMLRESFQDLKRHRDAIALQTLQEIATKMPHVVPVIQKAPSKSGCYAKMDNWEQLGLGIILLSGFERCLLRLEDAKQFDAFMNRIVTKHERHLNVRVSMMKGALKVSEPVMLSYIQQIHHNNNELSTTHSATTLNCAVSSNNAENSPPLSANQSPGLTCPFARSEPSDRPFVDLDLADKCPLCRAWKKFFKLISYKLGTAKVN